MQLILESHKIEKSNNHWFKKTLKINFQFPSSRLFKKPKTLQDAIGDINFLIPAKKDNKSNGILTKSNQIQNNEYMAGAFLQFICLEIVLEDGMTIFYHSSWRQACPYILMHLK